ncbi:phosphotransferase family protein [Halosegnis sp.]|uniref:phosphotransferase family protein n=1 Tax=Halosegnis sp. TaxID=2864959 RepID=UPI0035D4CBD2
MADAATVRRVLARACPDRTPNRIEPARRGNTKRTYLVEDGAGGVVVQLSERPEPLRVEAALARAVRQRTSVPVPGVLAVGTLDSFGYLVVERAPGTDLHERFTGLAAAEQRAVARAFGGWLAACHETFDFAGHGRLSLADGQLVAPDTDVSAWYESYLRDGLDALPTPLAALREPIAAAASPPATATAVLFPWDLRPGNALYENGVTAVLDWGEPLAAPAALSAAKTEYLVCDWYVEEPAPLRAAFRAGYRDVRPWPDPSRTDRLVAVVRSAVDADGVVTRPGYPEQTGETAVAFHCERLRSLLDM